jgi:hypothetical protein
MRYLGRLSGTGVVTLNGTAVARASYDFDGYMQHSFGITCSGEIRLSADALESVFRRRGVQLLTDEGRLLDLRFSGGRLPAAGAAAHVDVTGQLPPTPQSWHH